VLILSARHRCRSGEIVLGCAPPHTRPREQSASSNMRSHCPVCTAGLAEKGFSGVATRADFLASSPAARSIVDRRWLSESTEPLVESLSLGHQLS